MDMAIVRLMSLKNPGDKLAAIKKVRTVTSMALKEAKDLIDAIPSDKKFEMDSAFLPLLDECFIYTSQIIPPAMSPNKAQATDALSAYAKELLEDGKWDAAQNVCNLLSILKSVESN